PLAFVNANLDLNRPLSSVDSTCAPSHIRYPQDTSLLNEAREKAEDLIDALCLPNEKKPRTYRNIAHKEYVSFAKTKKKSTKKIRKQIKRQLGFLSRDLKHVKRLQLHGRKLSDSQAHQLEIIQDVYKQQKSSFLRIENGVVLGFTKDQGVNWSMAEVDGEWSRCKRYWGMMAEFPIRCVAE
ncbi:MAG: hypothetical protein LBI42_07185, partial [Chitinispirillales bacterium]|nr:hypothetical protein [Chitinispirillales bacterium]